MEHRCWGEPHRLVLVCSGSDSNDEIANPAGPGRIINNGSISAHMPRPNSAPYTANQARHYRTDKIDLARWPQVWHHPVGQIDIGKRRYGDDCAYVGRCATGERVK